MYPPSLPLVDGDVTRARGVEALLAPAAPTVPQPQAAEPRHEVELAGPAIAQLDGTERDVSVGQDDLLRGDPLGRQVVLACVQEDGARLQPLDPHALAMVEAAQVADEGFDNEHPAVRQGGGDV